MKIQVQGVFVRGGEDNPVAVYSDPRQARLHRVDGAAGEVVVLPLEATISAQSLKDAEASLEESAPAAAPAFDPQREQVRAEVVRERREAALRDEIEAELDAAEKPDKGGKD